MWRAPTKLGDLAAEGREVAGAGFAPFCISAPTSGAVNYFFSLSALPNYTPAPMHARPEGLGRALAPPLGSRLRRRLRLRLLRLRAER